MRNSNSGGSLLYSLSLELSRPYSAPGIVPGTSLYYRQLPVERPPSLLLEPASALRARCKNWTRHPTSQIGRTPRRAGRPPTRPATPPKRSRSKESKVLIRQCLSRSSIAHAPNCVRSRWRGWVCRRRSKLNSRNAKIAASRPQAFSTIALSPHILFVLSSSP
jgi:hypothetical protein